MYSLATAVLHRKRSETGLQEMNIGLLTMDYLFENFDRGYLVLKHTTLTDEYYLDLLTLKRSNYGTTVLNTSVNSWLYANRTKVLPLLTEEPVYDITYVNYADCSSAGFSVKSCHPTSNDTTGYTQSDLSSVYLSKVGVDGTMLAKHTVYAVNGLLHPSGAYRDGVRILDANKSMWLADDNNISVLSFLEVGEIKQVPLKVDMISPAFIGQPLSMEAIINLDVNLSGKVVLLSLGGHLVYSPEVLNVINPIEGIIHLKTKEIDLLTKIQNSRRLINLDALELSLLDRPNGLIDTQELLLDSHVLPYLTLPQSFIIIVDGDFLKAEKKPIEFTGIYGQYMTPDVDDDIIVDSYNRMIPYFKADATENPLLEGMTCISIKEGHIEANLIESAGWRRNAIHTTQPTISRIRAHECKKLSLSFYKQTS